MDWLLVWFHLTWAFLHVCSQLWVRKTILLVLVLLSYCLMVGSNRLVAMDIASTLLHSVSSFIWLAHACSCGGWQFQESKQLSFPQLYCSLPKHTNTCTSMLVHACVHMHTHTHTDTWINGYWRIKIHAEVILTHLSPKKSDKHQ